MKDTTSISMFVRLYNYIRRRDMSLRSDRDAAVAAIQAVNRPMIAIKVIAVGRSKPLPAFRLALEHIKPTDAIAVGMYTNSHPDQIHDNVTVIGDLTREQQ